MTIKILRPSSTEYLSKLECQSMSAIYLRARPGAHSLVKFQKANKYTMKLKIPYSNKLRVFVSVSHNILVLYLQTRPGAHTQSWVNKNIIQIHKVKTKKFCNIGPGVNVIKLFKGIFTQAFWKLDYLITTRFFLSVF